MTRTKPSVDGSVKFLVRYWGELCGIRQQGQAFDPKGKNPVRDSLMPDHEKKSEGAGEMESAGCGLD